MSKIIIYTIGFLFCSVLPAQEKLIKANTSQTKQQFAIIVHKSNDYKAKPEFMKAFVKQLYLKRIKRWPNKKICTVYARRGKTNQQKSFLKNVLNMTRAEVVRHFSSLKQRTGETKPRAVRSDRILARKINKDEGAFGVISVEKFSRYQKKYKNIKILFTYSD